MHHHDSIPPPNELRRMFAFGAALGVLLLGTDRVLKWFAVEQWSRQQVTLFRGAHLTYLLNDGIAFSIPLPTWVFIIFVVIVLAALGWFGARAFRRREWAILLALGWILLGAASNIADRIFFGGVVDYFQFLFPSVVNIADGMIVAGVVGVMWFSRNSAASRSVTTG